jgi:hypothetical protein
MSNAEEDPEIVKQKDVEAKMKIVEKTFQSLCTEDSEFEDLRVMCADLKDGGTLELTSLSGGITNYSFKVKTRTTTVYAKICFEVRRWITCRVVLFQ